ncbi:MAG: metallophosphoesterase, partial [Alkalibacterium sp.]
MKLTLFGTSDIHGYVYPTDYQSRTHNTNFGLLKLAALMKKERSSVPGASLAIENGDIIQGSPFTHYLVKHKQSAELLMNIVNEMKFDAGVIGNHEFNYGLPYLNSAVDSAAYPFLCANILTDEGKTAFGEPYRIFDKEGIKVAVLGLTTQYIPHWEHPENYAGLTFVSALTAAREYVPLLREQADIIVVSYHGGFEKDLTTGQPTETLTGENEGYEILNEVEGIDVFLSGHQHRQIAEIVKGTAVVMPGSKGEFLGKVELELEKNEEGIRVRKMTPQLLSVKDAHVDETLAEEFAWVNEEVEDWLDQP